MPASILGGRLIGREHFALGRGASVHGLRRAIMPVDVEVGIRREVLSVRHQDDAILGVDGFRRQCRAGAGPAHTRQREHHRQPDDHRGSGKGGGRPASAPSP